MYKSYFYVFIISLSLSLISCKKDSNSNDNPLQSSSHHLDSEFIAGFQEKLSNLVNQDDHSPQENDRMLRYASLSKAVKAQDLESVINNQGVLLAIDRELLNKIHDVRIEHIKSFREANPNYIFQSSNIASISSTSEKKGFLNSIKSAFSRLGDFLKFSAEKISKRFRGLYGDIKTETHYAEDGTVSQVHSIEEVLHNFYEVEKTRLEGVKTLLKVLPDNSLEIVKKGENVVFSLTGKLKNFASKTEDEIRVIANEMKEKIQGDIDMVKYFASYETVKLLTKVGKRICPHASACPKLSLGLEEFFEKILPKLRVALNIEEGGVCQAAVIDYCQDLSAYFEGDAEFNKTCESINQDHDEESKQGFFKRISISLSNFGRKAMKKIAKKTVTTVVHQNKKLTSVWEQGRSLLESACAEFVKGDEIIRCNQAKQDACGSLFHYNLISKFECISASPDDAPRVIGEFLQNSSLDSDIQYNLRKKISVCGNQEL